MSAYYNEIDPPTVSWLRELIREGLIADGEVDERSIADVQPGDLRGFVQCHFFAGIGGWSYALRLAGWDDARPVWTGSCPCQGYSAAGKGEGAADPRNLWPQWVRLIRECRPERLFGEQVESAVGHGWLDAVSTDLEAEGYTIGAVVLGAHSVGAPHIRQRLWFVADTERRPTERYRYDMGTAPGGIEGRAQERKRLRDDARDGESVGAMGNASGTRLSERERDGRVQRETVGAFRRQAVECGSNTHFWSAAVWLPCRDGKARPTQPGLFPLASGLPARVGLLRGAGNSIVPEVAAEVIKAYLAIEAA